MLVLRTCNEDMISHGGFVWPQSGPVECIDWDSKPHCGNGLHGFAWGEGDGSLADFNTTSKWLVIKVEDFCSIDLKGKVKFRRGDVVFCGTQLDATNYIIEHGASGPVVGATIIAGHYGTANVGDFGTASAGYRGTAWAGNFGIASAGNRGHANVENFGTASAGNSGVASAGDFGIASAGNRGHASVGDFGTASAGHCGYASAGDFGIVSVGKCGTVITGRYGIASAGEDGKIQIEYYDDCDCILTGYIGEDGLLPNVKYKVENGKFVMA